MPPWKTWVRWDLRGAAPRRNPVRFLPGFDCRLRDPSSAAGCDSVSIRGEWKGFPCGVNIVRPSVKGPGQGPGRLRARSNSQLTHPIISVGTRYLCCRMARARCLDLLAERRLPSRIWNRGACSLTHVRVPIPIFFRGRIDGQTGRAVGITLDYDSPVDSRSDAFHDLTGRAQGWHEPFLDVGSLIIGNRAPIGLVS